MTFQIVELSGLPYKKIAQQSPAKRYKRKKEHEVDVPLSNSYLSTSDSGLRGRIPYFDRELGELEGVKHQYFTSSRGDNKGKKETGCRVWGMGCGEKEGTYHAWLRASSTEWHLVKAET